MTTQLVQKRFGKGTREFEIVGDTVYVRTKALLRQEKLAVDLSTLDPEPVVTGQELEFHSRSKHGPVLSLFMNEPNEEDFSAFVRALQQGALREGNAFGPGDEASDETVRPEAPGWNVYEEPPDFDELDEARERIGFQPVNPEKVAEDITMLKTYLDPEAIKPLIEALEGLKAEPDNEAAFDKVVEAYNGPGISQGAVLTYAPYLKVLLSRSMW